MKQPSAGGAFQMIVHFAVFRVRKLETGAVAVAAGVFAHGSVRTKLFQVPVNGCLPDGLAAFFEQQVNFLRG